MMVVTEIDAEAFTMMQSMEMDCQLQIPPPDTFRRLGFGGVSCLAAVLALLSQIGRHMG